MKMKIKIKDTTTGEEIYTIQEFDEEAEFMWNEGNYACDCNRQLFFSRAKGIEPDEDDMPCGDSRFILIEAPFEIYS